MSHPSPAERPGNPRNPRAFFDVDIGGERGGRGGRGAFGTCARAAEPGSGLVSERGGDRSGAGESHGGVVGSSPFVPCRNR